MSVVLRGFVTPWPSWVSRWVDHRMQPAKSPLWLADLGRDGAFVGPFVDPQGRVRDEVVFYPTYAQAERELNLRATDFAPWRPWLNGCLAGADEDIVAHFAARIDANLRYLRMPPDARAYIREAIKLGIDLVTAIGKLRAGPPEVPPEFEAKLAERDRFVDRDAREHLRLVGKARGSN